MTLNINGLRSERKCVWFSEYLVRNSVDVVFVQEHNYRPGYELKVNGYNVYVEHAIRLKGGVAILVRETSPFVVRHCEGGEGRMIRVDGWWGRVQMSLVCVYGPAEGDVHIKNKFVKDVLVYYLRALPGVAVIGGDWNCVIRRKDVEPRGAGYCLGILGGIIKWSGVNGRWRGWGCRTYFC